MPRRSNYVQKIVYALERHIAGNAEVEQSPMLLNRVTGQEREVDIVISAYVGERLVRIGVETTSSRRPADVGWVDEMIGRHRDLPTDKLVLFSKNGFSSRARKAAESAGAETVTLGKPDDADWTVICGKLSQVRLISASLTPETGTATLKTTTDVRPEVGPGTILYEESGEQACSFQDLASAHLSSANVLERLIELDDREDLRSFRAEITLPPGYYMKDTEHRLHEVVSLKLEGTCRYEEKLADITSSSYRGDQIAHGHAVLADRDVALIVTESKGKPMKLSIVVYKSENDPGQVVDLSPREDKGMALGYAEEEAEK